MAGCECLDSSEGCDYCRDLHSNSLSGTLPQYSHYISGTLPPYRPELWGNTINQVQPLAVASGQCVLSQPCVTSPNYPSNYGNAEDCEIRVLVQGFLTARSFETEKGDDAITVNARNYSGRLGPSSLWVDAGQVVSWRSDSVITYSGWNLCWSAPYSIMPRLQFL